MIIISSCIITGSLTLVYREGLSATIFQFQLSLFFWSGLQVGFESEGPVSDGFESEGVSDGFESEGPVSDGFESEGPVSDALQHLLRNLCVSGEDSLQVCAVCILCRFMMSACRV